MNERLYATGIALLNAGVAGSLLYELAAGEASGPLIAASAAIVVWISLALLVVIVLDADRERRGH